MPGGLIAGDQFGEFFFQPWINGFEGRFAPRACPNIQQRGATGIAIFHHRSSSEPMVQIIMRKEDRGQFFVIFGLVFFEP